MKTITRSQLSDEQTAKVEKSLTKAQKTTIQKMEKRGGEPTLVEFESKFYVIDLSKEAPLEPRNITYDEAEKYAKEMGAELMTTEIYQEFRKDCDKNTWNWLRTNKEVRETGYAFCGDSNGIAQHRAGNPSDRGSFCAALRVLGFEPSPSLPPLTSAFTPFGQYTEIVEFLYLNDNKYPSKGEWREALLEKLREVLNINP